MPSLDPVFGDASRLTKLGQHEIKGSLLAARARYVRDRWGQAQLDALIEAVPSHVRRHLQSEPLPFTWYSFEEMAEIDRQIIAGPMEGDVSRIYDFGRTIARYDLNTLYKALFKLGTPGFILKRLGTVYGLYLRPGRAIPSVTGSREGEVDVREASYPLYFCRYGIAGWIASALEMSGAVAVQVEHDRCIHLGASSCHFVTRWER